MRRYGFILCAGLLACGGRSRSDHAGGGSGASSSTGGTAGMPAVDCLDEGTYGALAGPLADPAVVWARISNVVSGAVLEPPRPLPPQTSEEWAGQIALEALDRDFQSGVQVGAGRFLEQWIALPSVPSPERARPWAAVISAPEATLETLFTLALDEPGRAGIFTDPEWLSLHPTIDRRGGVMMRALLSIEAPAPPGEFPLPEPQPGLTHRESHEAEIGAPTCQPCHAVFDPLGFSLEHFDEFGAYRDTDSGKPVDSSGVLLLDGEEVPFSSIVDLAPRLAVSCEVGKAVSEQYLTDALVAAGVITPGASPPYPRDLVQVSHLFIVGRTFRALLEATAKSEAMLR